MLKGLNLVALVDEDTEYSLRCSMPLVEKKNGVEYQPEVIVVWPGITSPEISGTVKIITNRKIDLSLRMKNVFSEPSKITGWTATYYQLIYLHVAQTLLWHLYILILTNRNLNQADSRNMFGTLQESC